MATLYVTGQLQEEGVSFTFGGGGGCCCVIGVGGQLHGVGVSLQVKSTGSQHH